MGNLCNKRSSQHMPLPHDCSNQPTVSLDPILPVPVVTAAERLNQGWEWTSTYKMTTGPLWTLIGHSKARESTGFYLMEPQIYLDAGIRNRKFIPTTRQINVHV